MLHLFNYDLGALIILQSQCWESLQDRASTVEKCRRIPFPIGACQTWPWKTAMSSLVFQSSHHHLHKLLLLLLHDLHALHEALGNSLHALEVAIASNIDGGH